MSDSAAPRFLEARPSWRTQAASTVEELFPVTPRAHWNLLLDLRSHLLHGTDWNAALDLFLTCRETLEADHYLPFYRLRQLLAASLQLEAVGSDVAHATSLQDLFRLRPRSLAEARRVIRRELFEHHLACPDAARTRLRVVERN